MATQRSYVDTLVINIKLNFQQITGLCILDILFGESQLKLSFLVSDSLQWVSKFRLNLNNIKNLGQQRKTIFK